MKQKTTKSIVIAAVLIIVACAAVCGIIIWQSHEIKSLSEQNDPEFLQQQSSRQALIDQQISELNDKNSQLESIKAEESTLNKQINSVKKAIDELTTTEKSS